MSYELRMPRLTELMASAKIVKWLKKEGELIKEGEPLFLAESEKAVEEVPSPITGVLKKIVAQAGSEVNPDDLIAIIEPSEGKPEKVEEVRKEVKIKRIKISPRARRLAEQYGIDITKIKGTGPGGRIVERDIMRVVEQMRTRIEVPGIKKIPLNRVRKVIAERLTYGYREAVPSGIVMEVDATELVKFKKGISEETERKFGVKITYTDIFVKAVGLALEKHPILNSSFKEDHIEVFKDVNVGIAVATEEGVFVPVIKKVNEKNLMNFSFFIPNDTRLMRELCTEIVKEKTWNYLMKSGANVRIVKELISKVVRDDFTEVHVGPNNKLEIRKVIGDKVFFIDVADIGDGIERVLTYALSLEAVQPKIVLWDDIEASAHPGLVKVLLEWLASKNWQVILSTHSIDVLHALLDIELEDIQILALNKDEQDTLKYRIYSLDELEEMFKSGIDIRKILDLI